MCGGAKDKMESAKKHEHAKKGGACCYFFSLLTALFLVGFYGFMAYSNPDRSVTMQNKLNKEEVMYGCSALWWSQTPVNPSTLEMVKPGDANVTAVPTNVSANFINFFTAMFWISLISLVSTILACLGACSVKCGCCACLGGCLHAVANIAIFIMLILGSIWRWSNTGRACSGDYVTKPVSEGGNLCLWKEGDAANVKCSKEMNGNMWAENPSAPNSPI